MDPAGNGIDPELYLADFADMIRDLLRAIAADDYSQPVSSASKRLRRLIEAADLLPPEFTWYRILAGAVGRLKLSREEETIYDREYDELCQKCLKYVAEVTSSDSFSAARISKSRTMIDNEVRSILTLRNPRRLDSGSLDRT